MQKVNKKNIKNTESKKILFWAIIIFLFALCIRLIYLYNTKNEIWFNNPILDAKYYNDWAQDIIRGDWLSENKQELFMNPGYPYFLASVYLIFGNTVLNVVLIQIILGSLSCVLTYLITKKLFTQKIGIISGLLLSVHVHSIIYENKLLTVSSINFLNLLLLFLIIYFIKKPFYDILIGLILGISISLRPNIFLFLVFILFWIFIIIESNQNKISLNICIGTLLVLILLMLRNYCIFRSKYPLNPL